MTSIAALDRLLSDHKVGDLDSILREIAADRLWPGLQDAADVPSYLRGVGGETADLVASSLLILLQRSPGILDDAPWRPVAAEFLASKLDDLRPYAQKPAEKGSHAVFMACAGVVESLLSDFASQLAGFSDLKHASNLRNPVSRRLNGRAGSLVLRPFAPRAVLELPLTRVFEAADTLAKADESTRDAAFSALADALRACDKAVASVDTRFARATVGAVAAAVSAIADREIALSRPPAQIAAAIDLRPLPLREVGVTCDVVLHLENKSDVSATHVTVTLLAEATSVTTPPEPIVVGDVKAGSGVPLVFPITVLTPVAELPIVLQLSWRNPDHSADSAETTAVIPAQTTNIDWDAVAAREPFAPYPVEDADALVGRSHQLKQLGVRFAASPLANMYVTGQRRVGKTSLVRVLIQELRAANPNLVIATVEMGEVRQETGTETISQLGVLLARRLIAQASATGIVDVPEFKGSLAPLNEVVDELHRLDSDFLFLLVVDEFDELPDDMFRRGGAGDAIFLPVRSLAQKPFVGWILIGGERMPYIRDEQATRLNTFVETKVDYLEFVERDAPSSGSASSFAALVRRPLPAGFTVADAAIGQIHAASLGNPHFAKALCSVLYADAVRRRDASIQLRDVESGVRMLASQSDVELFAHFWEDGIFSNDVSQRRKIELERRHMLTAVAEGLRSGRRESERLEVAAEKLGLTRSAARRTQQEFFRRGVLADAGGQVTPKVPLFGAWLQDEGAYQLAPKGIADQIEGELRAADEAAAVTPAEVSAVLHRWRAFKFRGETVTRDDIDRWVNQFDHVSEQRLMFRLLERFKPVSDVEVLDGLRRLNRLIAHEGTLTLDKGQRTLAHILVAGAGNAGSSGQAIAYKYRQANNVRQRNVVGLDEIAGRVAGDSAIRAVVIVDDFIGSGETMRKQLDKVGEITRTDVQVFVFAISGIPEALGHLETSDAALRLGIRVEVSEPLTSAQRPFMPGSDVFRDADEQTRAEDVARAYGQRLVKSMPLGYGDVAALTTFPDNCPNNVPPIFWSDADSWRPLFPRTGR